MTVREIASRIDPGQLAPPRDPSKADAPGKTGRTDFVEQLRRAREHAASPPAEFRLSAHAQERIEQRGISLNSEERQSMSNALLQLESKGARDALLMRSDAAFIVNVPTRTVVTAVETSELQDRVFTQIDSAVML
jgi:flagellar operon protein